MLHIKTYLFIYLDILNKIIIYINFIKVLNVYIKYKCITFIIYLSSDVEYSGNWSAK